MVQPLFFLPSHLYILRESSVKGPPPALVFQSETFHFALGDIERFPYRVIKQIRLPALGQPNLAIY